MVRLISGLVLVLLMVLATILDKAYQHTPPKEIKRQARDGDRLAKAIYKSAAYGLKARLFLGVIIVLSASFSFVLLAKTMTTWLAFIAIAMLIWFDFIWLASTKLTKFGVRLGAFFAVPVSRSLHYLNPLLEKISHLAHAYYPFRAGTGLYDTGDITELLDWQKLQPDNRISEDQLEQAKRALAFNDKLVGDILTPLSRVQTVSSDDAIGPVLIDELTKSGQAVFPVFEAKTKHVVGSLALSDVMASAEKGGPVSDITTRKAYYLNEDFTLHQALQACLKSKHDLFMVVNQFEDIVGIVTFQDIVAQLVSQKSETKAEDYSDLKTVAGSLEPVEAVETETEPTESQSEELVEYPS